MLENADWCDKLVAFWHFVHPPQFNFLFISFPQALYVENSEKWIKREGAKSPGCFEHFWRNFKQTLNQRHETSEFQVKFKLTYTGF